MPLPNQHLKITFNIFHSFFFIFPRFSRTNRDSILTMIITIAINRFKATPRRLKSRLHRSLLTEQTSKRFHDGTSTPIDATMSRRLSPLTFFFFSLSLSLSSFSLFRFRATVNVALKKKKKKFQRWMDQEERSLFPDIFRTNSAHERR